MKVGLTLAQRTPEGRTATWAELEAMARQADEEGADSLWVADHFFIRMDDVEFGIHEAFTLLTAIAAVTKKVQVGSLVTPTSFRNPGMLAKVAATLDAVSGGRLILGLGCGWHEPEYRAFGYPFDHRVGRFEENVAAIRSLLHGEHVSVKGQWLELDDAALVPPPEHRIPIVIASDGPRMMSITARFADGWQCGWSGLPDADFQRDLAALEAACEAAGRTDRIALFKGIDATSEESDSPHAPIDAGAIADALAAWAAEGIDHLQIRVYPGTPATFDVALEGIRRFKG
jgi:alkanesulfonate monooxygenase SsuD/methylene tetrahydromethanopterin reductase-like flavin-dependent oxidoreductase (luciferase family)